VLLLRGLAQVDIVEDDPPEYGAAAPGYFGEGQGAA
jgi:hypothetical protein